ncbi:ABC transporter ATP-binding protein [Sediminitomix flava]|uniref:Phospholipid/cholesterol/gamma-HCH transport system ATP-binding protein n=1 Tax=Sediminitomix flava TaxID=379075 RepID=A0A315ZGZ5_SEDFL|nr:ATP-binding cassette domain-containing protein [Sediminitomix flava]PWJ44781.1 phospholipid/cholesterol/gamma-HCH transport system ATP-binding protein [Sediminitomix flava]
MIEITNIKKAFQGKEVLKGISAKFEQGQTNMIIGASGTGKSVLLKTIVGLIEPDSGTIEYNGRDFYNSSLKEQKAIRREIGMLFQGSALFDSKTVYENVKFPLDMMSKMSEGEKKDRVEFCLSRVGLAAAADKMPSEISGGMQKRVGIARAIVMNSQYLFCDEPNSGLDPQTSIVIDNLIQEITHEYNLTTIIVSHDMNSVMEIGQYILFMYQGHKVWEGSNETILDSDEKALHDFILANKLMQKFKALR